MTLSAGSEKSTSIPKALAVEVIQHVQQPQHTAITEAICHEVHRPSHVGCLGHHQRVGFVPLKPLAGFDPQVQFQLAVDSIDPLMVPRVFDAQVNAATRRADCLWQAVRW